MQRITFSAGGGHETLRPTHAQLLAAALGDKLVRNVDGTLSAPATAVATAAWEIRSRYRCRTVRADNRRVALLAEAAPDWVTASCMDQDELETMLDLARNGMSAPTA